MHLTGFSFHIASYLGKNGMQNGQFFSLQTKKGFESKLYTNPVEMDSKSLEYGTSHPS